MKKFYLFLTVLVFTAIQMVNAQAPQGIPYQAVARDSAGNLIKNHRIYLLFSIHDGTANGNVVFEQQHIVNTDELGLFSLNIGEGGAGNDGFNYTLSNVNWGSGAKFIQVKLDITGGDYGFNYVDMGTTQMMSVPYALYAGNSNTPNGSAVGNTLRWDGNKWVADNAFCNNGNNVGIGITTPTEKLEVLGNVKIYGKISANGGNASGENSIALGSFNTTANGVNSTAMGYNTTATSFGTTAIGAYTTASGNVSTSMGLGTTSKSFAETSIGTYNTDFIPNSTDGFNASDRLFVIGNGIDENTKSDAMVVLKNGNTTINGTTTANSFVKANGTSSQYLMADGSTSIGGTATTIGEIGTSSTANGGTITSGVLSLAPADESNAGIVTTGAQNFAGNKSLNGKLGIGINTNNSSAQLEVVSGSDIAIKAYPQNVTNSQIGVLGTYNLSGYGAGIVGVGYGGTVPSTTNVDLGVYGSSSDIAIWSNGSLKVTDGTQGSGKVLTSDGNGKASWQTLPTTTIGETTMGAIGTSSTANGGSITSGVLNLTPADGTNGGIVTSNTQTFGGNKTFTGTITANNKLGVGTSNIATSAKMEVNSTTQGFLPPRLTAGQRNAIVSPVAGLTIWCSNCGVRGELEVYDGVGWTNMIGGVTSVDNTPTVVIGSQTWTTQNLNVSVYRNGDPIPQVTDDVTWASLTTGAYCYYNNDSATYASTYGKLYNWYAVTDSRGLAPAGYHIPTDAEWFTLRTTVGANGGELKTVGTTNWTTPNYGATNSSGFSGIPGGIRSVINPTGNFIGSGIFKYIGIYGTWWSTSFEFYANTSTTRYFGRTLFNGNAVFQKSYDYYPQTGYSVRCVGD